MQVIAINASPNMDKGNTALLLAPFLEGMAEAGAEVELFYTKKLHINPCQGEFNCWLKTPGRCVQKDDMSAILFDRYLGADLVVENDANMAALAERFRRGDPGKGDEEGRRERGLTGTAEQRLVRHGASFRGQVWGASRRSPSQSGNSDVGCGFSAGIPRFSAADCNGALRRDPAVTIRNNCGAPRRPGTRFNS